MSTTIRWEGSGRRVSRWVGVAIMSLGVVGACTTTTGEGGGDEAGGDQSSQPTGPTTYPESMAAICAATDARIAGLPTPPSEISESNWAAEVARAYRDEAAAADDLIVDEAIGRTHRTFVTTTEDLATQWAALGSTLASDPDGIGEIRTDITQLALGRDDLATELAIDACRRSAP